MVPRSRVLVAMSGGVDSSVAAALLQEQGHELVGVTLHLWDAEGANKVGRCCAPEDRDDARRSAEAIGIPHYVIDERSAFRGTVVEPFLDAYTSGRTPSPCVACNQHVKLGRLLELADDFGCQYVATGHYARVVHGATPRLLRGIDRRKDQSYFLFGVRPDVLNRLLLPLGERTKPETRDEGRRLAVPNAEKRDSQELCFVPDGDIRGFVKRERGHAGATGRLVSEQGDVVGSHDGVAAFTVGQRRGLGLGGGPARYVLRIVADSGDVVVGDDSSLGATEARVAEVEWTGGRTAHRGRAEVQVRYKHTAAPAELTIGEDGDVHVRFDEPQRAVAPGQAAVFFDGDEVIGGGRLAEVRSVARVA